MKGNEKRRLISIIVAACNIEKYVSRCLDSLLAQSYPYVEIILVDDGSVDHTGDICDCYAERDGRIKVIHQENRGLSGARNSGLRLARGEYIGFVDGDDWIEAGMYEAMLEACEDNGAEMAICAYREVGGQNEKGCFSGERYLLDKEDALDAYVCDDRSFHIYNSVWSKLFHRSLIDKMEFAEGRKSEDIIYTTKAMLNMSQCVFLDIPYYNYMADREDSIMKSGLEERRFHDEIPFWKEQIQCFKDAGFLELSQKAEFYFYRRMLFYYMDFRDRKMTGAAQELIRLLREEKERIRVIYRSEFVKTGDRVRMRLFSVCPQAYYLTGRTYEQLVVPLRQKLCSKNKTEAGKK